MTNYVSQFPGPDADITQKLREIESLLGVYGGYKSRYIQIPDRERAYALAQELAREVRERREAERGATNASQYATTR